MTSDSNADAHVDSKSSNRRQRKHAGNTNTNKRPQIIWRTLQYDHGTAVNAAAIAGTVAERRRVSGIAVALLQIVADLIENWSMQIIRECQTKNWRQSSKFDRRRWRPVAIPGVTYSMRMTVRAGPTTKAGDISTLLRYAQLKRKYTQHIRIILFNFLHASIVL